MHEFVLPMFATLANRGEGPGLQLIPAALQLRAVLIEHGSGHIGGDMKQFCYMYAMSAFLKNGPIGSGGGVGTLFELGQPMVHWQGPP